MIHLRRASVTSVRIRRPGLLELECDGADGARRRALAYEAQTGPAREGDTVILNTSAVALGLGTGGWDFVIAVEGAPDRDPPPGGHAMKLRYTPVQSVVEPVEETHRDALDAFEGLSGAPVVLGGLHSTLPAIAIGARWASPNVRLVYVMTDAGALPLAISDTVAAMCETGLLDATITAGQSYGGDREAVNVYSGLAAAAAVERAGVIVCGMGPGNIGTDSRLGFALLEQASLIHAVSALGGEPLVVPRLSMSDARERHRGLSHHTRTVLRLATASCTIVLPRLGANEAALIEPQLDELLKETAGGFDVHTLDVADLDDALRHSPVPLLTMGRSYADDPLPFRAAAAAGAYAATRKRD